MRRNAVLLVGGALVVVVSCVRFTEEQATVAAPSPSMDAGADVAPDSGPASCTPIPTACSGAIGVTEHFTTLPRVEATALGSDLLTNNALVTVAEEGHCDRGALHVSTAPGAPSAYGYLRTRIAGNIASVRAHYAVRGDVVPSAVRAGCALVLEAGTTSREIRIDFLGPNVEIDGRSTLADGGVEEHAGIPLAANRTSTKEWHEIDLTIQRVADDGSFVTTGTYDNGTPVPGITFKAFAGPTTTLTLRCGLLYTEALGGAQPSFDIDDISIQACTIP